MNTQDGQGRYSEEYEQFLAEDIITDETAYLRMLEFGFLVWLQQEGMYKRTNLTCLYAVCYWNKQHLNLTAFTEEGISSMGLPGELPSGH